MTKWQESCIKALASSPYTWEAFKMKQKNKNLLWQYINRIWPYHRVNYDPTRECVANTNSSLEKSLIAIKESMLKYKTDIVMRNNGCNFKILYFKITNFDKSIIKKAMSHPEKRLPFRYENFNHSLQGDSIDVYASNDLIDCLNGLYENTISYFSNICGSLNHPEKQYTACLHSIDILLSLYNKYQKKNEIKKKIPKTKINWLNIGIEIEHDAENATDNKTIKRILQQNCISYNSGYDNNNTNRLRENRIRLNGIKGLKGLYTLLQNMRENAEIANDSSVHIHIDCDYDNSFKKLRNNVRNKPGSVIQVFTNFMKNETFEEFKKIFKIKENISKKDFIRKSDTPIRFSEEFETIEYRFCIPNFNYSDYVIQILFLIHITECLKHNAKINKNYVKLLAKLITDLRN